MSWGVRAEQAAVARRIGVLQTVAWSKEMMQGFRQGVLDAGRSEGRDLVIEWRRANGDLNQLPRLVNELVERKVELIVADTTPAAGAAKRATSTIPFVMAIAGDPVGSGLVANLVRPGGNVTGLTIMATDLPAKRLQLLKEAIPRLTRVAVLWNPDTPYHPNVIEELKTVAPSLSVALVLVGARTPQELGAAFSAARRANVRAMYVIEDGLFFGSRVTLSELTLKGRLPAIYAQREFVDEGGLMSYGPNLGDQLRRAVGYVEKILKGAQPNELPIEQPTKFEFIVNLKTAKVLGISIPQSILARANEVIR